MSQIHEVPRQHGLVYRVGESVTNMQLQRPHMSIVSRSLVHFALVARAKTIAH